ncbi:InlB B-repeat-containing protein [Bifidobacteriaceae bacterium NR047]|nr:InlB B-repeat-containing protein [Bifidobacteriaceae bacterium NR047]
MSSGAGTDKTETAGKPDVESEPNPKANTNPEPESKPTGKPVVNTKPKTDTKTEPETKPETAGKPKTTEKNDAKPETSTNNNQQMLLASTGKPDPNKTPATQTTELRIIFQWGEMNDEYAKKNNGRLIKADSDFGEVSTIWAWGTSRKSDGKDVETAFEGIKYTIFDNTDKKVVGDGIKGSIPKDSLETSVSLGRFDSSHTYTVSVVNSTIPSPYFVTYNASTADGKEFKPAADSFTWIPKNGTNKDSQEKGIRLDVLEIVYAKDESVAKNCFSYTQPKKGNEFVSEGNWQFKYNNDNIFAKLRVKENAIQFPKTNPTKVGYKFAGWQYYVVPFNLPNVGRYPYTSMFRGYVKDISKLPAAYSPFNKTWTVYPYMFTTIRDNKGVNVYSDKCGSQYGLINHTFVVFPKWEAAGYKVTFINEGSEYAQVKVQEGKSINSDEWTAESMPTDPSKPGFTFNGWFTAKDGKGTKFTGDTPVSADISVYSSYTSKPPTPPTPPAPTPEPEPEPTPEPEPDIDWDDIPDIDLTPDKEPEPVPFIVAPAPILPPAEAEPEPTPAPSQPEQSEQQEPEPKHVAKHLPKTGSTATPILASAIASLFAGLAGLAESFALTRKRRN